MKVPTETFLFIASLVINSERDPFPLVPPIKIISLGFLKSKELRTSLYPFKLLFL